MLLADDESFFLTFCQSCRRESVFLLNITWPRLSPLLSLFTQFKIVPAKARRPIQEQASWAASALLRFNRTITHQSSFYKSLLKHIEPSPVVQSVFLLFSAVILYFSTLIPLLCHNFYFSLSPCLIFSSFLLSFFLPIHPIPISASFNQEYDSNI